MVIIVELLASVGATHCLLRTDKWLDIGLSNYQWQIWDYVAVVRLDVWPLAVVVKSGRRLRPPLINTHTHIYHWRWSWNGPHGTNIYWMTNKNKNCLGARNENGDAQLYTMEDVLDLSIDRWMIWGERSESRLVLSSMWGINATLGITLRGANSRCPLARSFPLTNTGKLSPIVAPTNFPCTTAAAPNTIEWWCPLLFHNDNIILNF